ncbi:MAG: hypothetical protein KGH58_01465 [Candidatus Micrarchaeota archaeon]|nr:hypothetical protein [Candidatus Micrarchaeota archaeon]
MTLEARVAQDLDGKLVRQIELARGTRQGGVSATYDQLIRSGVSVTYNQVYTHFRKNGWLKAYRKGGASELTEKDREEIRSLSETHDTKEIMKRTGFSETTIEVIVGNYRDSIRAEKAKGKEGGQARKQSGVDAFKWSEWIRVID